MGIAVVTSSQEELVTKNGIWYIHVNHEKISDNPTLYKCLEYKAQRIKPTREIINTIINN